MLNEFKDFVTEKTEGLTERVQKIRMDSSESVRGVVTGSAENLKLLKSPVRQIARSGIKLTAVTQTAAQSLIELQADVLTAGLSDAALRLERASRAENVIEFVRDQIELMPATRDRVVEDAKRAVKIFKDAGRDLRHVASNVYTKVVEPAEQEIEREVKAVRRKAKRAVRKTKTTRARKAA